MSFGGIGMLVTEYQKVSRNACVAISASPNVKLLG